MSRKKKKSSESKTDVKLLAQEAGDAFRELEAATEELSEDAISAEIPAAIVSEDWPEGATLAASELNLDFAEDEGEDVAEDEPIDMASDDDSVEGESAADTSASDELAGTELEAFESAEIEDVEVLTEEQIRSVVESVLFSTDKPLSIAVIKQSFKGTNVKSKDIREALNALAEEYGSVNRGFTLHEVGGGFQLRTKPDNLKYLRQTIKARPFKLSGPALEVLSIVAYKQPVTKHQMDEIRGVESGHVLRALMEKGLVNFGERSDLPGKPMFYETTRKFLEIFGLRNIQELPSLNEIDQLIPEGIGDEEKKETLSDLTAKLSEQVGETYSVGEDELLKITDELSQISTSSEFFEQEKQRMRDQRDKERAQNIRDAQAIGEAVEEKDVKWLERYEAALAARAAGEKEVEFVTEGVVVSEGEAAVGEDGGTEIESMETVSLDPDSEPPTSEL